MAEVFAGFVCGYAVALVFTPIVALTLVSARSRVPYLAKAISPNISVVALTIPISLVAFLIWTAVGMVMGLLYRGAEESIPQGGLGSPNLIYTALVVSFGVSGAYVARLFALPARDMPDVGRGTAILGMVVAGSRRPQTQVPPREFTSPEIPVQQLDSVETATVTAQDAPKAPAFRRGLGFPV